MSSYLGPKMPIHQSSRNLFCLQYGLCMGFDLAQFVIVPKGGKFVVHFLKASNESAGQYHNVIFDHGNNLSHEALYTRFAWALFHIIKELQLDSDMFNFQKPRTDDEDESSKEGGGGGRQDRTRKRKRGGRGDDRGSKQHHGPGKGTSDTLSLQPNDWLSDVVFKMAPPENQSSLEADIHEIEKDLRQAASHHPFLGACEVTVSERH